MLSKPLSLALLTALALCGCKKDESKSNAPAPTGLLGQATEKAKQAKTAAKLEAALPQPDASKPLSSYPELKSGQQIMFLYVAASKLPPDFEKLAESFSQEYRETNDSFRKNDLMQAIKPQLAEKIALAKAAPYGWMEVDDSDNLGAYDFDRKGFPVGEFEDSKYRYFNDNYNHKIGWANYSQVAFVPVADEAAARQIEAMRSKYGNTPRLNVYFFAQSADLDNERVNALVTRVQITDKSGRVLVEYGPDGSVAPQSSESSQAETDAACATGDAAACDAAQAAVDAAAM